MTLLDKTSNRTFRLDATFEPNRVSSVFVLGLTSIVDSLGFKFVTKLTSSVPNALPTTGFAPTSSYEGILGTHGVLAGLGALSLLGATYLFLVRRWPGVARGKLPRQYRRLRSTVPVDALGSFPRSERER